MGFLSSFMSLLNQGHIKLPEIPNNFKQNIRYFFSDAGKRTGKRRRKEMKSVT
jgi:hypothetical protein